MEVSMPQVSKVMDFFVRQQKKYNFIDSGNIVQQKWDMRDIARSMPSGVELQQLIEFFMMFSDDRSFKYFSYHYDEYYDTMLRVKEDRLRRRYLQNETLSRSVDTNKVDTTGE